MTSIRSAAAALATEIGPAARFALLDVSSAGSFAAAIELAVSTWGRLDIVVNNAGTALPAAAVQDTSDAEFDRLIAINLRGVFNGCKLAYPHLKQSKGCVLNISSMSGITGQERHAIYSATKGAINALNEKYSGGLGQRRHPRQCPVPDRRLDPDAARLGGTTARSE